MTKLEESISRSKWTMFCPNCKFAIKLSAEIKGKVEDYPIRTVIDCLNEDIGEEDNKIKLKRITENYFTYKAEVTTKLTDKELKELVNKVMGYCEVCGRSNASFGVLSSRGPRLYEGGLTCGGIGDTTMEYTEGVIKVHDPVPDVNVELKVVKEEK